MYTNSVVEQRRDTQDESAVGTAHRHEAGTPKLSLSWSQGAGLITTCLPLPGYE